MEALYAIAATLALGAFYVYWFWESDDGRKIRKKR